MTQLLRFCLSGACLYSLILAVPCAAAPPSVLARPGSAPPSSTPAPIEKAAETKAVEKPPALAVPTISNPQQALVKTNLAEIKLLEQLLQRTTDTDPEKADILWRYAGLCREMAQDKERQERALDAPIQQAKENKQLTEKKQQEANQRRLKQTRLAWLDRAKKALLQAADGSAYKHYEKMDQVLASAAYLLRMEQDEDAKSKTLTDNEKLRNEKIRTYYLRLVEQYPASTLVGDAYFFLGELALDGEHGADAFVYYDKAIRSQTLQPGWIGYALYKKGWAGFLSQHLEDSKQAFLGAIRWAKQRPKDRNGDELIRAAFSGFVRAFAQNDSFADAKVAFEKIDPELMPEMMRKLAAQFADNARYSQAIPAYEYLLQTVPDRKEHCNWRMEIVKQDRGANGGRPVDSTLNQIKKLVSTFETLASTLGQSDPQVLDCASKTQSLIQETVTQWHQEAFKTRTFASAETTLHLYEVFTAAFPSGAQAESTKFWMAELLFLMGSLQPDGNSYCAAAPLYSVLIEKNAMPSHLEDMAYNRLVSWQGCLDAQDKAHPSSGGEDLEPIKKTVNAFLQAAVFYLSKIQAKEDDRAQVLFTASRLYLRKHEPASAIPLLEELIQKYPKHPAFASAISLLLDAWRQDPRINTDIGYLDSVLRRLDELSPSIEQAEKPDALPEFKLALSRKKADLLQQQNQPLQAARLYQSLAETYSANPSVGDLWNNAVYAFRRAGLVNEALTAIRALNDKKPAYPRLPKLYYQGALWLYEVARFKEANEWFGLALSRLPATSAEAETALATEIYIHRQTVAPTEFLSLSAEWLKRFGNVPQYRARAREIATARLAVLETGHDEDTLQAEAKQYLDSFQPADGIWPKITTELRLGLSLWRKSCGTNEEQGLCVKQEDRPPRRSCSTDSVLRPLLTPQPRNPDLIAEAQRHFDAAFSLVDAQKGADGDSSPEHALASKYVAMARFALANAGFEDFLHFQVMPENLKKFKDWNLNIQAKRNTARALYETVIQTRQGALALAAWSRLADMNQVLVDSLMYAPIPKVPPVPKKGMKQSAWSQKFEDQYCDQIGSLVSPLEDSITKMFLACQTKAGEFYMDNEWTQHCSERLAKKQPVDFPVQEEILPQNLRKLSLLRALPESAELTALPAGQRELLEEARGLLLSALSTANTVPLAKAIEDAERVLALDGASVLAYRLLVQSYLLLNPIDPALLLLFAKAPKDNPSLLMLQGQYQWFQHAYSDAFLSFSKALKLNPQATLSRLWLGSLSLQVHSPAKALEHFEEVLKTAPDDKWALIGKGIALREGAKYPEAEQAYRLSLKSDDASALCAAQYDLGVLYRSFLNQNSVNRKSQLVTAKGFFQTFVQGCQGMDEQLKKAAAFLSEIDQLVKASPG
jgi:hypothetical protein